jgi:hypothetical protein
MTTTAAGLTNEALARLVRSLSLPAAAFTGKVTISVNVHNGTAASAVVAVEQRVRL